MEYTDIEKILSESLEATTDEIEAMTSALAGILGGAMAELDTVSIPGFGTFYPEKREERVVLHPETGRRMLFPPKIVPMFRPSSLLTSNIRTEE